jgi:hypothetical protein
MLIDIVAYRLAFQRHSAIVLSVWKTGMWLRMTCPGCRGTLKAGPSEPLRFWHLCDFIFTIAGTYTKFQ